MGENNIFRKSSHARSADEGQGWEEAKINDTLNIFDNSENRTPTLVVENHPQDSRIKVKEDGIVQTLASNMGEGGEQRTYGFGTYCA